MLIGNFNRLRFFVIEGVVFEWKRENISVPVLYDILDGKLSRSPKFSLVTIFG